MKKLIRMSALILMVLFLLTACFDPNKGITDLALVVTADDIVQLDEYPDLQKADLTGSDCYEAIEAYIAAHPEIDVAYTVSLGGIDVAPDVSSLALKPSDFDYNVLTENLKWLPNVNAIEFMDCALTVEQIESLKAIFPALSITYQLGIGEQVCNAETTQLDLSWVQPDQLEEVTAKMKLLPNLVSVKLTADDGSNTLGIQELKSLQEAFPNVMYEYSFELFGKIVSTADERIEYDEVQIGNEGASEIRSALDVLTNCTYAKFDDCGIDSEVMAGIRDDYPNVKVVWRIHVDKFSMLTDETMIRMTHRLVDTNISELKYATEVTYMDIGHNPKLTDISFVACMPKLECVIISGSSVTDISYFANCPNLTWLECCFCGPLEDISSLVGLQNLKYLNVSYTKVSDLTSLENVPLERLNCMHTKVSYDQKNQFLEKHPDCLSVFKGKQPYGYGWRYNDHGYTFFEYYINMREVFRYDDKEYTGNQKE